MHRSACVAAGLVLTALVACGGEPDAPVMEIRFAEQALLEDASKLALYFYGAKQTCMDLRTTLPRARAQLGPFAAPLSAEGREAGVLIRRTDIPVGTYSVLVDALDTDNTIVGTGCAENQQVFDREVSPIRIVVAAP
ncbi:MAG: hypothetical protein RIU46_22715 [Deltaproteobacteria bacterium]|jgi:hypothetical protein